MTTYETLFDSRSECVSVMASMTLEEYKNLAYDSFAKGGNLDGQRDVIKKSAVAAKIRKRMMNDFNNGAIFPPVVIGVFVSKEDFEIAKTDFDSVFDKLKSENISIIDGMQRSNIYFNNYDNHKDRTIRVEFWVSPKSVKLLYRMLVLNTGQVPWNTRRQIEVIYDNLSDSFLEGLYLKQPEWKDSLKFMTVDDNQRRTQPGKYQKSTIIELYLGFNTRSIKVDVSEELANEFQRFDMMEAIDRNENYNLFIDTISYLIKLDYAFSNCKDKCTNGQFKDGTDLFTSVPACLGFVVACAEYVIGKVSVERTVEKKEEMNHKLCAQIEKIVKFASSQSTTFLALNTLNDIISSLSKSRIGDEMRRLFKNAFSEMIKYEDLDELESLEVFWRE